MKGKKKKLLWCLLFTVLISITGLWRTVENYQAEESMYSNAMEFFYNTGSEDDKHIKISGGTIYFGSRAKLAHTYASGHTYYNTLGYDITMTGGGKSMTFSVKRGGSLSEVPNSVRTDNSGYEYLLYSIPTEKVIELAKYQTNADVVLAASEIKVRMDAIVTVRQNGVQGSIVEDGKGGITEYEANGAIYHLKNQSERDKMMEIFSGHKFVSYYNIVDYLENYKLTLYYNVGSATIGNTSFTKGTYSGTANMLFQSGSIYNKEKYTLLQPFTPMNPGSNGLNLSRTGYHLESGAEWKKSDGTPMSIAKTYIPENIEPHLLDGDKSLVLYSNWKANTYEIIYNANGGNGMMSPSVMTYDVEKELLVNAFSRAGYTFKGWSTNPKASIAEYTNQQSVENLTSEQNGRITLYAIWEPCVYQILISKKYGKDGIDEFYERYETGFYLENEGTDKILDIRVPWRIGYDFDGYYGLGGTPLIVNAEGTICVKSDFFKMNAIIYEKWHPKSYIVTYDKQGGISGAVYGTETAVAVYDALFPVNATAPQKKGFSFQGYYTEKQGFGIQIYNSCMATEQQYTYDRDITLFAYWMDDICPELSFTANYSTWTKKEITLSAKASDYGSGLSELMIYKLNPDGTENKVAQVSGDGDKELEIVYTNEEIGITRYRAVAVDQNGYSKEAYAVTYYDVMAPTGTMVEKQDDFGKFYFEIDITDIDIGD